MKVLGLSGTSLYPVEWPVSETPLVCVSVAFKEQPLLLIQLHGSILCICALYLMYLFIVDLAFLHTSPRHTDLSPLNHHFHCAVLIAAVSKIINVSGREDKECCN